MKHWRMVSLAYLPLALGLAAPVEAALPDAAASNVDELRAWLGRRNQERKKLGLAVPETPKKRTLALTPLPPPARSKPQPAKPAEIAIEQGEPVLHIGHGADGRIHVRYVLKDEGPDELQVRTQDGYLDLPLDEPAPAKNLTPRGKRAWAAGASLRNPAAYRAQARKGR